MALCKVNDIDAIIVKILNLYTILFCTHLYCYKLIQRFRVTGLITGQYTTGYFGTFTDVI